MLRINNGLRASLRVCVRPVFYSIIKNCACICICASKVVAFLEEQAIWWELLGDCGGQAVSRINNGPRASLRVCVRQALYSMKKVSRGVCHSIVAVCTGQQYVGKTFSSAQCAVVAAESVSTHYESHVSCKQ